MAGSTRSLICSFLGHVDHGKTSLLDKIRGTAVTAKEAGGITQAIGASIIPADVIKKICGPLLEAAKINITIPGLLLIDTPGHAAFTSLRKRGGSIADIAVLVIDINEGFMPQTEEAIEILKASKTPFIIAANKIDLIEGWQEKERFVVKNINSQNPKTMNIFETKMYEIVGRLYEKFGLNAERFDRVEDYTKQIAIVPCSAKTGMGVAELLMVLAGLAQRFLEQSLKFDAAGSGKGTILEVKEEKGLGKTIDVILYDGSLKVGDTVVIGAIEKPFVTKIKAMFEPEALAEMRATKKFRSVKEVIAATGVKIVAPEIENAVAGMPVRSCKSEDTEKIKEEIKAEIEEVIIEADKEGIIIKADTLGSLEALTKLLRDKGIKIKRASIGSITKKDLNDAETNFEKDPLTAVVLGFNIGSVKDAGLSPKVKIISSNIIYKLIEDFEAWAKEQQSKGEELQLEFLARPCKIQIMTGYVFRQSNPAVVGCDILAGVLKTGVKLMKENGQEITTVRDIQSEQESVGKAERGKQVAVSMDKVTVGRQIKEGDILYSAIPENDFIKLKELRKYLKEKEVEVMKEIAAIRRKENPVWGMA